MNSIEIKLLQTIWNNSFYTRQAGKANNCLRFTFPLYSEVKSSRFCFSFSLYKSALSLLCRQKKDLPPKNLVSNRKTVFSSTIFESKIQPYLPNTDLPHQFFLRTMADGRSRHSCRWNRINVSFPLLLKVFLLQSIMSLRPNLILSSP